MTIYGLILAGGEGSRLGFVRKADLRVGGKTLLERVSDCLGMKSDTLFIATGATRRAVSHGISIPDLVPNEGPMGGIRSFIEKIGADSDSICVTAAVDSPFLPDDYVERLVEAVKSGEKAALAWAGENFFPTHAAWRVKDMALHAQLNSPKKALEALKAKAVAWSASPTNPFENINSLDALLAAQKRAEGLGKRQTIHRVCE